MLSLCRLATGSQQQLHWAYAKGDITNADKADLGDLILLVQKFPPKAQKPSSPSSSKSSAPVWNPLEMGIEASFGKSK